MNTSTLSTVLALLLLFSIGPLLAQNPIPGTDAQSFQITSKSDTINYLVVGKADKQTTKPTLLFLQGSLPVPLVFDLDSFYHINLPFDYRKLTKDYQIVVISMPHTPLVVDKTHLNRQYCYVPDASQPKSFSRSYLEDNHLDQFVQRTQQVIQDLRNKPWVNAQEIHLVGHSQGAKIAAVVAAENEQITSVSLLGFNAFGRFDEFIRKARVKLRSGQINGEQYQKQLEEYYEQWRAIHQDPDNVEKGHLSWTSFSIDYTPYLLKIEAPMYIGYGTEDIGAENCDLIPLKLIEQGKTNFTLKPFEGWNHNFFELKEGRPDYKQGPHWTEVMTAITTWHQTF
ncbi:hypothetical protein KFE98_15330 [bacterium SCSIO 12741]|nr:hypothetical protein KFE98_15330 [bacterium SCSIO 12741]